MYTIYGGNLHNEASAALWFQRRSRPSHPGHYDIALLSEVQKFKPRRILRAATHHTYFTGPPDQADNNAGQETGILLSNALPNLGGGSYFLTPQLSAFDRVGKERWGQVRVTRIGDDRIALINIHPVTKPKTENGPPRLIEYNEQAINWASHQILMATRLHMHAVLGVDVNVRSEWETSFQVKRMIDRHHLEGLWVGRDLLKVTPGLKVTHAEVLDGILHDHPLLVLGVRLRRNV